MSGPLNPYESPRASAQESLGWKRQLLKVMAVFFWLACGLAGIACIALGVLCSIACAMTACASALLAKTVKHNSLKSWNVFVAGVLMLVVVALIVFVEVAIEK
jgi:hypothetical protein